MDISTDHSYGRATGADMALGRSTGLDITKAPDDKQAIYLPDLLLTAFTSLDLSLSTEDEPFCLSFCLSLSSVPHPIFAPGRPVLSPHGPGWRAQGWHVDLCSPSSLNPEMTFNKKKKM